MENVSSAPSSVFQKVENFWFVILTGTEITNYKKIRVFLFFRIDLNPETS